MAQWSAPEGLFFCVAHDVMTGHEIEKLKQEIVAMEIFLKVRPGTTEARIERMRVLKGMGNYKKALEECTGLIAEDPSRPDLYYQRAKIFEKLGDSKMAKHDIARAEEIERDISASQRVLHFRHRLQWTPRGIVSAAIASVFNDQIALK